MVAPVVSGLILAMNECPSPTDIYLANPAAAYYHSNILSIFFFSRLSCRISIFIIFSTKKLCCFPLVDGCDKERLLMRGGRRHEHVRVFILRPSSLSLSTIIYLRSLPLRDTEVFCALVITISDSYIKGTTFSTLSPNPCPRCGQIG